MGLFNPGKIQKPADVKTNILPQAFSNMPIIKGLALGV
jgi:hypothetical protein